MKYTFNIDGAEHTVEANNEQSAKRFAEMRWGSSRTAPYTLADIKEKIDELAQEENQEETLLEEEEVEDSEEE